MFSDNGVLVVRRATDVLCSVVDVSVILVSTVICLCSLVIVHSPERVDGFLGRSLHWLL